MTKPRPCPSVDLLRAKNPRVEATMPFSHEHSEALVFPAKVGIRPKKGYPSARVQFLAREPRGWYCSYGDRLSSGRGRK